jgi:alpha-L-fucosidase
MKHVFLLLITVFFLSACSKVLPPVPFGPVPSEKQLAWHEMEYYMFVHFSMNTYEKGYGNEDESIFNPTELDCSQWAKTAKDAGMKGIIITAKHHDGFCIWPSKYTEHCVKNSLWRNGEGDVLMDLRKACDEYGLKMGVYLSPWDRSRAEYGSPEYLMYYRNQLSELLTNYGDIFEVWFDGFNGGSGYYGGADEKRIIDMETYYEWPKTNQLVRDLQPNAVIFSDAGPDVRWVGNERGMGSLTNWCLINSDTMYAGGPYENMLGEGQEDGRFWVPTEVDVSIRPNWFYYKTEDTLVRSPENLLELYYSSVGRNSSLHLNVPADKNGLICENDIKSLAEFRQLREKEFKTNLAKDKKVSASGSRGKAYKPSNVNDGNPETYWATKDEQNTADLIIDLGSETEVNRIILQEYIRLGQRVKEFKVSALVGSEWKLLIEGTTIGYKVIRKFSVVKTSKIKLTISKSKYCPVISNIELYKAPVD